MFSFETLFIVDEEELFEDRQLYKADENIFAAECKRVKAAAISQGMTKDEIKDIEIDLQMEVQDRLEIIELIHQIVDELLLVHLSRKRKIDSDIADYLGYAFDDGIIPLMSDYEERSG
ncbi:MAG: hypothetical protein SCARUB_02138 [Candidatus Scalindua rubra]|uniref:Uncharacterized protein n=1 Tax=Candidatus Scalindua rubra TaxID=1872076 RepID=A0A1E3XAU4_9BACT|nr:MAG: hypothetical protein SCARUB_02138 [Candidatus Scalindua rubra]